MPCMRRCPTVEKIIAPARARGSSICRRPARPLDSIVVWPTLVPWGAGHEGVERRPELAAIVILLLQDLMLAAGQYEMPAGQQIHPECLDRRGRDHFVAAGGDQQDRLADVTGVAGRG